MLAILVLGACGGGDDAESDGGGSSSSERARVRLTECLREQGIEVPEAGGGARPQGGGAPPDIDREQLREALEGPCERYQREAFGDIDQEDQAERRDQIARFTDCVRRNGVDLPDFEPGGGEAPPEIDRDDPAVEKAFEACSDEIPQGGPGGPGQ